MVSSMHNMERLLTPGELAEIAGVSAATIKREFHRGQLRGIRVGAGRLIRIPESAWREYLEARQPDRAQYAPHARRAHPLKGSQLAESTRDGYSAGLDGT